MILRKCAGAIQRNIPPGPQLRGGHDVQFAPALLQSLQAVRSARSAGGGMRSRARLQRPVVPIRGPVLSNRANSRRETREGRCARQTIGPPPSRLSTDDRRDRIADMRSQMKCRGFGSCAERGARSDIADRRRSRTYGRCDRHRGPRAARLQDALGSPGL